MSFSLRILECPFCVFIVSFSLEILMSFWCHFGVILVSFFGEIVRYGISRLIEERLARPNGFYRLEFWHLLQWRMHLAFNGACVCTVCTVCTVCKVCRHMCSSSGTRKSIYRPAKSINVVTHFTLSSMEVVHSTTFSSFSFKMTPKWPQNDTKMTPKWGKWNWLAIVS